MDEIILPSAVMWLEKLQFLQKISDLYMASKSSARLIVNNVLWNFFSFLNRVLPSVYAKMGGQFPSCATIEPEIEGTWHKFMNNGGLEVGEGPESFRNCRNKALAFAHWTFHKFDGKLLVCDLQGKL